MAQTKYLLWSLVQRYFILLLTRKYCQKSIGHIFQPNFTFQSYQPSATAARNMIFLVCANLHVASYIYVYIAIKPYAVRAYPTIIFPNTLLFLPCMFLFLPVCYLGFSRVFIEYTIWNPLNENVMTTIQAIWNRYSVGLFHTMQNLHTGYSHVPHVPHVHHKKCEMNLRPDD